MTQKTIALMDCNNFFASCEKIFEPKIKNKPLVVLSNNDGCVIARSKEAKSLGIPMGAPAFKWQDVFEANNVILRSANFQLYGDISGRIMEILKRFTDKREIYSIDEAFLDLTESVKEHSEIIKVTQEIRDTILKWTGVHVSVGVSYSKTLAKLANETVKRFKISTGTLPLLTDSLIDMTLKNTKIEDLWGIGRGLSNRLNKIGIYTGLDFKKADDRLIRSLTSVVGQRMHFELNGVSCIEMDINPESKKMIMSSRSFGKPVTELSDLKESVSCYIQRASEKLRSQNSVCMGVGVSLISHKDGEYRYYATDFKTLNNPTSFVPELTESAFEILESLYKPNIKYKKTCVYLTNIYPSESIKMNLLEQDKNFQDKQNLMQTFDSINKSWGRETIKYASGGTKRPWKNKRELVSKRYTTSWDEMFVVG